MRQFTAADSASFHPDNSGRAIYKPSGISKATHDSIHGAGQWGEYSHLWDAADWRPGVRFVQPEFLDNYSLSAGYWDIQDFSFEEVTEVVAAGAAANAAAVVAGNAQTAANAANIALAAIASDDMLTRGEKAAVIVDYTAIVNELGGIQARAIAYGISVENAAYGDAVSSLTSYLSGLTPSWSDLLQDTPIAGADLRAAFLGVYSARQALLNRIAQEAGLRASWSGVSGSGKPQDNATVGAEFGVNISGQASTDDLQPGAVSDVWVLSGGSVTYSNAV